ncbi:M16 family metallopeptidase [Taibaiella chishuiensis]|uniref:Zinc protease n=1 Tax=Taibaiella chishuiensis TaxID=1434707 RepID=A0A2P8D775_9BACT|nr:pitrilysin family protein [Taibaiella chishuiensis]PSK93041.1 zinc protease [Taibaiella chishuiensis]
MKKLVLTVAAAAFLCSPSYVQAQAKLVEKVSRKGSDIVIPYEKYVLPNGLTLLIHEDHSDPIVHVDVTYHVGSAREEIGKSGFAHFFEHMMFQGSDNVADEEHFKVITEAGGTLNGTTNRDRTNYFETVPANQLEKMLWLESDRMGFLIDAVTQKKFEVQRATVKNERGQNYDNRPYGLVGEVTSKNLYPYGHPYSWLTIGYIEDLNRVNADDLKNFFLRWYGPNNAIVTVGGDVDPKQVVALVTKYFGSIPAGPKVEPVKLPAPVLNQDRYVSMTDNYAKLPMLRMVYPGSASFTKDEVALDCLAEIIGQGKNSIFYKNFIKTNKAVSASASNPATELAGEFSITVLPYPGQKLSDMEKLVRESFTEFEKRGITDEELSKYKNSTEANLIYQLESVSGKVSQLASYATFTGNPNYIGKQLQATRSLTKADVMSAYNRYIKGKYATIVSVQTKGSEGNVAAADNYTVSEAGYKAPDYGYSKLKYNKAKDNFDRSKMPAAGPGVVVKAPEFWQKTLPGGIKAIGTVSNEIPVVTISINIKGGKMIDGYTPDKTGLASLFSDMMNEDTKNYTAEAFATALDNLGSSIDVSTGEDNTTINVRTLHKNLDKTLQLLEERLLHARFTQEAFISNQKKTSESVKNALNRPTYVADNVFSRMMYGTESPYGKSTDGTEATIARIQLADIENFYKNYFSHKDAEVIVVGDVPEAEITGKLGFLQQMPGNDVQLPALPATPASGPMKVYFVDVPNAAQTEFRVGYVTDLKYDALQDYYKAGVMNYPLGGAFNSRLNLYLREDKGWTYGARSYFTGDKYTGSYTFGAGIKADATDSALVDVFRIIDEYRKGGIKEDELKFTQSSMTQSEARKYETGFQKAIFLDRILTYNLPKDVSEQQNKVLNQLTVSDINALATRYVPEQSKLIVVLVGDKAKLMDRIKAKGYEVAELDKFGAPVK